MSSIKVYFQLKINTYMQDIENEVESLNCEVKMAEKQKAISFLSMLKTPFRWPMLLSIMVILSQQLTGVNAAMFVLTLFFMFT